MTDLDFVRRHFEAVNKDPDDLSALWAVAGDATLLLAEVERLRALRPETTAAVLAHMNRADAAEEAIARVRELHQPRPDDYPGAVRYCSDCLRADEGNPDIEWPCATIRTLDGEVSE